MNLRYFKMSEFKCPCCGRADMDERFLRLLDEARATSPVPFRITSGFRCEEYNKKIGGVDGSAHTHGLAVDIHSPTSNYRYYIHRALNTIYEFNRFGLAGTFIHVDMDTNKPQNVIWLYT